jgi:MFS family permease
VTELTGHRPATLSPRVGLAALLAADLVTTLGTWVSVVAIPWLVFVNTGSPVKMGTVAAAEWGSLLLSGAFATPLADRLGMKTTTVGAAAGCALAMAAVAAVPHIGFLPLVLLVAVAGALRGVGDRSMHVLLGVLVKAAGLRMIRVTGAYETMNRTAQLLGAPMAGLLVSWFGAQRTVWVDAISFLVCGALIAGFVRPAAADQAAGSGETYFAALRAGARRLWDDQVVFGMTAATFLINMLSQASIAVFIPLWISDVLGSPKGLGLVIGAFATGALLGSIVFTVLATRLPTYPTFVAAALMASVPRVFVLGASAELAVVLVVTFLSGLAASAANPIFGATLYDRVPTDLQNRVFGLVTAICVAGPAVGGALAGWAVTEFGLRPALLWAGVLCLVLMVTALAWYRRGLVEPTPADTALSQPAEFAE